MKEYMQLIETYNYSSTNKIKVKGLNLGSPSMSTTERDLSVKHSDKDPQVNITFEDVNK